MAPADRGMVEASRAGYRFRYREPCSLPVHEIITFWRRTHAMEWARDCHRMTLWFMRHVDTGFEV